MSRAGVRADLTVALETVLYEWTAYPRPRVGRESMTLPAAVVTSIDQDFETMTMAGGTLIVAEVSFITGEVVDDIDDDVLDALVDDGGPLDLLQEFSSPHWHELVVINVRDAEAVLLGLSLYRGSVATLRIQAA